MSKGLLPLVVSGSLGIFRVFPVFSGFILPMYRSCTRQFRSSSVKSGPSVVSRFFFIRPNSRKFAGNPSPSPWFQAP